MSAPHMVLREFERNWASQLTGANGENVHSEEEWDLCCAILEELPGTTGHNEDVTNTADNHTPEDHGKSAKFGVRKISSEQGENVCEQTERLGDGILRTVRPTTLSTIRAG